MRELTEEELKLAPEWATHYFIDELDAALYAGINKDGKYYSVWWFGLSLSLDCIVDIDGYAAISKKPFDITKYEWSDSGIELCESKGGVLILHSPELTTNLVFDDAIAIAKTLGLTAEDLK